ncbi:helix-turn-helix domain-containing protein, partial [Nostoc sp. NIES-2111]
IEVSERHIKRLLKQMGLSTLTKNKTHQKIISTNEQNTKISIDDITLDLTSTPNQIMSIDLTKLNNY